METEKKVESNLKKFGVFSKLKQQDNDEFILKEFELFCESKNIERDTCLKQVRIISPIVADRIENIPFGENYFNSLTLFIPFSAQNHLIKKLVPEYSSQAKSLLLDDQKNLKKELIITRNNNSEIMRQRERLYINTSLNNVKLSLNFTTNEQIELGSKLWVDETEAKIVELINKIRNNFYENLFINSDKSFDKDNYNGGLTIDSKVETKLKNKIEKTDLLDLVKHLDGYLRDDFVLAMHPNTLQQLEEDGLLDHYYKNPYFHKIPIVSTFFYPYKKENSTNWKLNDKPIALFSKRSIIAYGLDILVFDVYKKINHDELNERIVETVGELKLCDPNLYAKYLIFKNE